MFSSCYPGRDDSSCPAGTEEGDGLGGDPNCDHVFAMGRCVKCGLGLSGSDDKTESDVNKCPAGGYHNWTLYSKKIIRCSKCGTFENIY